MNQQARKLEFEQQKYQHFLKVQAFRLKQREIELQQFEQEVHLLAQQLEDMEVKAGIQGTLQSLDVEIGESLPEGATLGRVGSVDQLLARLRVPQHQADQIAIGAAVELNTRKGQILGEVNRIESLVSNGVLAEVTLHGELNGCQTIGTCNGANLHAHTARRTLRGTSSGTETHVSTRAICSCG